MKMEEKSDDNIAKELHSKPSFQKLLAIAQDERLIRMEMGDKEAEEENKVLTFDFKNISYEVKIQSKETKAILKKVSGSVSKGEIMALMGPSGSGKTSLLNVLSQRVKPQLVSGSFLINKREQVTNVWKRKMGFVFQDDLMLPNLTVRETILFSARLRLPQRMSRTLKEEKVDALIDLLGLEHCAHNPIGSIAKRGVSGGERKRTAIGVELIIGPSMTFLDEPTSGLDSSTALMLMTLLRKLADCGMIFFASIHQPRSNIFSLFDKVILLDKGKTVFSGKQEDLVPYLTALGLNLPPFTTPADWVLDMITSSAKLSNGKDLTEAWKSRDVELGQEKAPESNAHIMDTKLSPTKVWATTFSYQLGVLLERQYRESRGSAINKVSFIQNMFLAATVSALWWQTNNVTDILGFFFFVTINQSFSIISAVVKIFPMERDLVIRERSTGYYRVGAYFLARTFSDMVTSYILPMLYALLCITCTGLASNFNNFMIFWAVFLCALMAAQAYGIFISCVFRDFGIANMIAFTSVLALLLIAGFYVEVDRLPTGLQWLPYFSFVYWTFKGMAINYFSGNTFGCDMKDDAVDWESDCTFQGDDLLRDHAILAPNEDPDNMLITSFCALALLMFFFRISSYLFLRRSIKETL